MTEQPQKTALLIAGPTASGKSALALQLARERGGVIINADSMQVYRELRVLTARPTVAEEAQVPHRLYGHVSGAGAYSVAQWLKDATQAIHETWAAGRLPIICGGTGLYFMALEEGLSAVPAIPENVRARWRQFDGDLHAALAERDPVMAARLSPTDRQRLVRALEVREATGQSLAHWQEQSKEQAFLNGINVERHFVEVPREELYRRAEGRFEQMLREGALEEVGQLPSFPADLPMMRAIGVPELSAHLRGEISLAEATAQAKLATRHYIKRQLTWWRGRGRAWFISP